MRVIRITRFGGPEAFAEADIPPPAMGPNDLLIRVHAAGVNRADLLQRRGLYPPPAGFDPMLPGLEYAGIVEKAGAHTSLRRPGDRVMGLVAGGAYAQYLVVNERETLAIPDSASYSEAAAIPEAFLTAYRALFDLGGLTAGDSCLIRAATSSVGIAACQLAHWSGAVVIGTSRSSSRLARLEKLGLSYGCVDGEGSLVKRVRASAAFGVEVVLDLLGGGHLQDNLHCLRDEGRLVLVGMLAGTDGRFDLATALMRRLSVQGMTMRSLPLERRIDLVRRFERHILPLFDTKIIWPVLDDVYDWSDATAAHERMESGRHFGKIVLSLS
ncbi:MAG: NAD(P)H-quinone oxidoreductase [Pseudomonadota bacterium]|nr:NAD(P)H-quinone oxidoreductase [Pseudomonadota bacterium]